MKKKVVSAGNICLDITLPFPDHGIRDIGQLLSPGRLTEIKAADVHTGGSVANTGLAMKLLGADVTLVGKVETTRRETRCDGRNRFGGHPTVG